jgi:hypothetical protein
MPCHARASSGSPSCLCASPMVCEKVKRPDRCYLLRMLLVYSRFTGGLVSQLPPSMD